MPGFDDQKEEPGQLKSTEALELRPEPAQAAHHLSCSSFNADSEVEGYYIDAILTVVAQRR
jgi:hypothetical protein